MIVLTSILLALLTLVISRLYGIQRAALIASGVFFAVLAIGSLPLSLAIAPFIGLGAAIQVERQRLYGLVVAAMAIPGFVQAMYMIFGGYTDIPFEEQAELLLAEIQGFGLQVDESVLREMVYMILNLVPGAEFLAALLSGVLAYRMGCLLSGPLRLDLPMDVPMKLWRPWPQLFWALLVGLVLTMLGGLFESVGLNLVMVVLVLYAVQGLAVVRFYFDYVGLPSLARIVFYMILLFSSGFALLALTLLGLLEARFDWRRLSLARQTVPSEDDPIR